MEKTKPRLIGPFKVDEARSHLFKMNTTSAGGRTVAGLRIAINRYAATTAGLIVTAAEPALIVPTKAKSADVIVTAPLVTEELALFCV